MMKKQPKNAASIRRRDIFKKDEDGYQSESSVDSDTMLQEMFYRGELKPGLNVIAETKEPEKKINKVKDLKLKLKTIELKLDWIERLDIVTDTNDPVNSEDTQNGDENPKSNARGLVIADENDPQHDFKRETRFCNQAQSAVLQAIPKLHQLGVRTKRPDDYFAQMIKSDEHMKKVRQRLVEAQKSQELSLKAKKLRELKKYGKQTQNEVLKKRQKDKKEMLDVVKKYKKGKGSFEELQQHLGDSKGKGKEKGHGKNKREVKNKKYGFGGRKKGSKLNTAKSSAEYAFNKAQNSVPGKKSKKNKGKKQRPGKMMRQKMKGRK